MSAERNQNDTERLSAYIDGQLTTEERLALEARLQTDADLRRQLALLRATVDLLKDLPTLTAPRDFRLTREMVGTRRIYTFSILSAAAAVVLLVVGFGLLTTGVDRATQYAFSNIVSNLEAGRDQAGVALLPSDTVFSTPTSAALRSVSPVAGGEQAENVPDSEDEFASEGFQQAQATLALPTGTPPPSLILAAPPLETAAELDHTNTTIVGQSSASDGRGADAVQTEPLAETPASSLPFDAIVAPTESGAAGVLALQPSPELTNTPLPTLPSPTTTVMPTEVPSSTPTNTSVPTIAPMQPPAPSSSQPDSGSLVIVIIVIGLVLLVASIFALILNRRR